MIELPKWPLLLVKGKKITKEQADLVILRTTWLEGLRCNDERWNRYVKQALRLYKEKGVLWVPREKWDELRERLGVLSLDYLTNDRISSIYADGPHGWCDWDGTIGTDGMTLLCKWPEIGEVHDEWTSIAHAFPFLELEAQLVRQEWDESYEECIEVVPLVRWTVARGAVEMHADPGELIRPLAEEEDTEKVIARMMRPGSEAGVHYKRLTQAVRRCESRARKGK